MSDVERPHRYPCARFPWRSRNACVAVLTLLSACSGGSSAPAGSHTSAHAKSAADAVFRIVATDEGYDAPDRLSAGLRHVVFENHGHEIHEAMFVKLGSGMTPEDYVNAVKAGSLFPENALDYSGAGLTSPGQSTEVWLQLDPGEYILICWYNDHPETIPVHPLTVVADGAPDDVPPPNDLTLRLVDYRFELDGPVHPGTHVIRVETPGPSMHEVDLFRLLDGKTAADVDHWYKVERRANNPAPAVALGGVLDSHDIHHAVWLRKTFEAGRYSLHCGMQMVSGSGELVPEVIHADIGMSQEFVVE